MLDSKQFNKNVGEDIARYYWGIVMAALGHASNVSSAVKLKENLGNPEFSECAKRSLNRYYKGRRYELDMHISQEIVNFEFDIKRLNQICYEYNLPIIRHSRRLLNLLADSKRRRTYYKKAAENIKGEVIVALQEIEEEYKKGAI